MKPGNQNSFNSLKELNINGKNYSIYSLKEAEKNGLEGINKLPKSIKVLLENLLRYEDNITVNKQQILSIKDWLNTKKSKTEIAYRPARVLLQDYTGIPAVADLAAMRDTVKEFVDREIISERSRFENKDYGYTKEVMQKAGELGFLGVEV